MNVMSIVTEFKIDQVCPSYDLLIDIIVLYILKYIASLCMLSFVYEYIQYLLEDISTKKHTAHLMVRGYRSL